MDTIKFNKSKVLLAFQSVDSDIQSVEDVMSETEQKAMALLEKIRVKQEETEK